jgi:hypothetical protein
MHRTALTKADDLESLAYTLISFFCHSGCLPWNDEAIIYDCIRETELFNAIMEAKKNFGRPNYSDASRYVAKLPVVYTDFLAYCQELGRDKEPDYDKFIHLFQMS